MKWLFVIMFAGALPFAQASTNTVVVTAFQEGKRVELVSEARDRIVALSIELLRTASYEADASVASDERFKQAEQASHVRLDFASPRSVTFTFSTTGPASEKTVEITEMVIPISVSRFPDYIFVREQGRIRAFAKYAPKPAQALQDALKK